MKKTLSLLAAAAIAATASVSAVQAATVSLGFGDIEQGQRFDTVESGNIAVTVIASGGSEGLLTLFSNDALGVGDGATGTRPNGTGTDGQDLLSVGEALTLQFRGEVTLSAIEFFESSTGTDTVKLTNVSDGSELILTLVDPNGNRAPKFQLFNLEGTGFNNSGSAFVINATGTGNNPGVALQSIDVAPVPLPATLPLLAFGLGGVALMARRKKA